MLSTNHKPRCKICSHYDTRCSMKFHNDVTISAAKSDCDTQIVVYILSCAKCPNADYVSETSNCFRFRLSNHKHSIKLNLYGYPVAMHFNEQSHTMEDMRCTIIRNHVPNMDDINLFEQRSIIKLNTHITDLTGLFYTLK